MSAAHKCTSEPAVKLEEDHAAGACSVRVGCGHGCVDDGIFVVVVVVASVRFGVGRCAVDDVVRIVELFKAHIVIVVVAVVVSDTVPAKERRCLSMVKRKGGTGTVRTLCR